MVVSQLLAVAKTPSRAALAAMAKVSGGRLSVKYERTATRKVSRQ